MTLWHPEAIEGNESGALRRTLEADESARLAPYAARSVESRGRRFPERAHPYRTLYMRDRDRIIHSSAFRRLLLKTQVFVGQPKDHQRNRLTHTLEVAQISRTIARALRLNEDLTEAIALAHDLGHPPFGHAGERVLDDLLVDIGGFEHNWQGYRMVTHVERSYPDHAGLNLSWELLESLASRCRRPVEELAPFRDAGQGLGEAQVVALADDLAYTAHDLDDAVSVGLISTDELEALELWRGAKDFVPPHRLHAGPMYPRAVLRGMLDWLISSLLTESQQRLATVDSPDAVRRASKVMVVLPESLAQRLADMKQFLFARVYRDPELLEKTQKGERMIEVVFSRLRTEPQSMPARHRDRLADEHPDRVIADFLAGMTDRYLEQWFSRASQG